MVAKPDSQKKTSWALWLWLALLPVVLDALYLAGPPSPNLGDVWSFTCNGSWVFSVDRGEPGDRVRWDTWFRGTSRIRNAIVVVDPHSREYRYLEWWSASEDDPGWPDIRSYWARSPDGKYLAHWWGNELRLIDLEHVRVVVTRTIDHESTVDYTLERESGGLVLDPELVFLNSRELWVLPQSPATGDRLGSLFEVPSLRPIAIEDSDNIESQAPYDPWTADPRELRMRGVFPLRQDSTGAYLADADQRGESSPEDTSNREVLPFCVMDVSHSGRFLLVSVPFSLADPYCEYIVDRHERRVTEIRRETGLVIMMRPSGFFPQRDWLLDAKSEDMARLVDPATMESVRPLLQCKGWIYDVVFSPDGSAFAASVDHNVVMHSLEHGRETARLDTRQILKPLRWHHWGRKTLIYLLAALWCAVWLFVRGSLGQPAWTSGTVLLFGVMAAWACYWELLFPMYYFTGGFAVAYIPWYAVLETVVLLAPIPISVWWLVRGRSRVGYRVAAVVVMSALYQLALDGPYFRHFFQLRTTVLRTRIISWAVVLPAAVILPTCWRRLVRRKRLERIHGTVERTSAARRWWQLSLADVLWIAVGCALALAILRLTPLVESARDWLVELVD